MSEDKYNWLEHISDDKFYRLEYILLSYLKSKSQYKCIESDIVMIPGRTVNNLRADFVLLLWSKSPASLLIQSAVLWRNWLLWQALWAMFNHAVGWFSQNTPSHGMWCVQTQPHTYA
jgi:hypothetical protein